MHKNYNNKSHHYQQKNNNYLSYNPESKHLTQNVLKATEEGFTGPTSNWFSDAEFYKNLPGNSDEKGEKDYYFNSYSSFYIHEEMIKDSVRTQAYKSAIEKNAHMFKDKIVLDIGCGTSILSIFAARAGAKHVYAIEFADIADYAKEIVKMNNLSNKITIVKSKVEEAVLPVDSVDIIISEWMGYFLLYESMLDTVLFARDKWLRKDGKGLILPDRATISVAAIEDANYKSSKLEFWNDVGYDINMSCVKGAALSEPLIDICPMKGINSTNFKILDIDLYTCTVEDLDFSAKYEVQFFRNDSVQGLVAWFDCYFDRLDNKVELSTSAYKKSTHWKQTIFYTNNDLYVAKNDKLTGSIAVRKSKSNPRALDIKISYHYENLNKGFNKNESKSQSWVQQYKIR